MTFWPNYPKMPKFANKLVIAVDIDDVLAEHIEAFVMFSNSKYATDLKPEDYSDDWSDLWSDGDDEVERRAIEFHSTEIDNFGAIQEALPVLKALKNDYRLVIVSARRKDTINRSFKWMDKNLYGVFEDVHFVHNWEPNNEVTKADICKSIKADYFIDDLIRHCNLAAETGIKTILFDRVNWNQPEKIHQGVVRVQNWQEVMEY